MTAALAMLASGCLDAADRTDIAITRADGTSVTISAELATTRAEQEQGLMNRTDVPAGTGMLFVYVRPTRLAFWMKDTLVPLDMLFFNKKNELVFINANATPKSLAPVGPEANDVCSVLEIAGGEAARLNIKVGDRLVFDTNCK